MRRSLIGSDTVIVLIVLMDLWQATVFATTASANGSIGMSALLLVFHWQWLASLALLGSALGGIVGLTCRGISPERRLAFLVPQQTLLLITALAAIYAILRGSYADGILRSFQFISCDQFPRIGASIAYTAAIIARVRPVRPP